MKKLIIFMIIIFFFITVYSIENGNLTNETSIDITNITAFNLSENSNLTNETSVNITDITNITNIIEFDLSETIPNETENIFNETEDIVTSEIVSLIDLSIPQVKSASGLSKKPKLEYVPDEVLVKFKKEVLPEDIENILQEFGINKISKIRKLEVHRLKIPSKNNLPEIIERLKKNPFVEFAEPNYIAYASMIPNDPFYFYQWHFDNPTYRGIYMEPAWDVTTGNPSIIVAVVDTGVAYEDYPIPSYESKTVKKGITTYKKAPDLVGTSFWINPNEIAGNGIDDDENGYIDDINGWDFIHNDSHPNDNNAHGTHVTGTIAQTTNNSLGVAGIAFNTTVMPIKVLDYTGSGTYSQVANGIIYAIDNGAKIISMSLGGPSSSTTLKNAVDYAYKNNVTVIAACGNSNVASCDYPAAYGNATAVGATQYDETRAPYSNYGSTLDLVAPGGNTGVDQNGDGYGDGVLQQTFEPYIDIPPSKADPTNFAYWFYQGTSMSTPHVSGVAALLLALNSSLMPDNIRNILQSTAEDLGASGWDQYYGYGLINASAAVNKVLPLEFISITLFGYPINFGNLDPETNNNSALGNSGNQYKIRVDPETTINVDLYQKGNNFTGPAILGISNMSWYNTNNVGSAIPMKNIYENPTATNIIPNTNISSYYWINIPVGQKAGSYTSTIYIKAVETGT